MCASSLVLSHSSNSMLDFYGISASWCFCNEWMKYRSDAKINTEKSFDLEIMEAPSSTIFYSLPELIQKFLQPIFSFSTSIWFLSRENYTEFSLNEGGKLVQRVLPKRRMALTRMPRSKPCKQMVLEWKLELVNTCSNSKISVRWRWWWWYCVYSPVLLIYILWMKKQTLNQGVFKLGFWTGLSC